MIEQRIIQFAKEILGKILMEKTRSVAISITIVNKDTVIADDVMISQEFFN